MIPGRTLNPLHFEDLEPHRFEDLVRQLAYDYRPWHQLEAVGRSGSDEGVDIRGVERVKVETGASDLDADDEDAHLQRAFDERVWVIQCKRERKMPPARIRAAVEGSLKSFATPPYGFILGASADFSAAARSTFRELMRDRGVEEFALWGKAELEDKLFEPRHDHLLFAYFGISIQTRRRSNRAVLTNRLATKRRLAEHLGDVGELAHKEVLVRDAGADDYPYPKDPDAFLAKPRWRYYRFYGHLRPEYISFVVRESWAWIKNDKEWDALEDFDQEHLHHPELFAGPDRLQNADPAEEQARRYWLTQIPVSEQGHLRTIGFIHYDRVVVVDDIGDRYHPPPHVLVHCVTPDDLFDFSVTVLEQGYGYTHKLWHLDKMKRKVLFPTSIPDMTYEEFSAALDKRHKRS